MHRPDTNEISLLSATEDDIPSLVRMHMDGFADENPVRVMFKDKHEYEQMLLDRVKAQLSDPNVAIVKAISKDTGDILGWQACRFLGKDDEPGSDLNKAESEEEGEESDTQARLRSMLKKDSIQAQKTWVAGKEYIHFNTLVVDPSAQGRGVGTALVRWVRDKADEEGIYCWLKSSQVAHDMYLKAGFKDVASLEVDLSEYAPGGKDGGWGWGMYRFAYMLWSPKSKT